MSKNKQEEINKKQNVWIEIVSVLFIIFILSFNSISIPSFDLFSVFQNISTKVTRVDQTFMSYTANVSDGLDIAKETLPKLNFSLTENSKDFFMFVRDGVVEKSVKIEFAYTKGVEIITQESANYANVFSSNLVKNLGVIDRQFHTAKTNFCK